MVERIAVSTVIYNKKRGKVIGTLRANDPTDRLANLWGLPAASLRGTEIEEDAIKRIGWQKLGTTITPVQLLGQKTEIISDGVRLTVRLWEARARSLPNFKLRDENEAGVSQYVTWRWMSPDEFVPTARKGSLCTQILLQKEGVVYE